MKRFASLLLVTTAGLFLAADAKEDDVKKEWAKLKGAWKLTSLEVNGNKPLTDEQQEMITLTFDEKGKAKVQFSDMTVFEADAKLDLSKKPKSCDYKFTEGQNQRKTALGIYELKDDTLKLCRAAPDKERPTEFSAKEGSEQTLATYKRAKAK